MVDTYDAPGMGAEAYYNSAQHSAQHSSVNSLDIRNAAASPVPSVRSAGFNHSVFNPAAFNPSEFSRSSSAMADAKSVFNDAKSTFSTKSKRARSRRRTTRAAAPLPEPMASAKGMHRSRARSVDSSASAYGMEALAPSEMWKKEQEARARGGTPAPDMRYVPQAAVAERTGTPTLRRQGTDSGGSYASLSAASASGHGHGSISGHGHGSQEGASKSSLPLPPIAPARKEGGLKLLRRDKKDKDKAKLERDKSMRKSNSFSLLRGGSGGGTANSSVELLVVQDRMSSSSHGSEERRRGKSALFRSLYDPDRGR